MVEPNDKTDALQPAAENGAIRVRKQVPSNAQARKLFHDWLDRERPWSRPGVDVYEMMDEMVDRAASIFRNDHRPTKAEYRTLEETIMRLTETFVTHPDWYDGPCYCTECRNAE